MPGEVRTWRESNQAAVTHNGLFLDPTRPQATPLASPTPVWLCAFTLSSMATCAPVCAEIACGRGKTENELWCPKVFGPGSGSKIFYLDYWVPVAPSAIWIQQCLSPLDGRSKRGHKCTRLVGGRHSAAGYPYFILLFQRLANFSCKSARLDLF